MPGNQVCEVRNVRWITTYGKLFGAGHGADTRISQPVGSRKGTSVSLIVGTGCSRRKPEIGAANRNCCGWYQRQALGSSGMSKLSRTLIHSTPPGTRTSRSERGSAYRKSCRRAACPDDFGSSRRDTVRYVISPSTRTKDGQSDRLSHSRMAALARSPTWNCSTPIARALTAPLRQSYFQTATEDRLL
jgi:hypothetical protein